MTLETLLGGEVPVVHRAVLLNQLERLDELVSSQHDLLVEDASGRTVFDQLAQMGRWRTFAALLQRYPDWITSVHADPACLGSYLLAVTDGKEGADLSEEDMPLAACFDWAAWSANTLKTGTGCMTGLDFLGNAGELVDYAVRTGRWQPEAGMIEYLQGREAKLAFAVGLSQDSVMLDVVDAAFGRSFQNVHWIGPRSTVQGRVFHRQEPDDGDDGERADIALASHGETLLVLQGRPDLRVGDFVLPGEVVSVRSVSPFAW